MRTPKGFLSGEAPSGGDPPLGQNADVVADVVDALALAVQHEPLW